MNASPPPETPSQLAALGEGYRLARHYREAVRYFKSAIQADESYAWAHAHLGATYQAMGKVKQAAKSLEKAIALKEDYAWAYAMLGETYRLAVYSRIFNDPLSLLSQQPLPPQAPDDALHQQMLRWIDRAIVRFEQAVERNPGYYRAIAHLGSCYRLKALYLQLHGTRNISPTPQGLQEALEYGKTTLKPLYEKALIYLDSALEKYPTYAWAMAYRGATHKFLADFEDNEDRKRKLLRRALKDVAESVTLDSRIAEGIHYEVGMLCAREFRYEAAINEFEQGLLVDPHNTDLLVARAITMFNAPNIPHNETRAGIRQAMATLLRQSVTNMIQFAALNELAAEGSPAASGSPVSDAAVAAAVAALQELVQQWTNLEDDHSFAVTQRQLR